ncbi:MAG: hypothetical protein ACFCU4_00890 [Puniceicoccaceae bacterium]
MLPRLVKLSDRSSGPFLTLGLLSLIAVAVWIFFAFRLPENLLTNEARISVSITRTEVILILILLFLNVLTAYVLFRRMQPRLAPIRGSITVIITTFLVIAVWISLAAFQNDGFSLSSTAFNIDVQRLQILLVLILVFANLAALIAILRKFRTAENFITVSAYSKKVKYRGEWITLENWLATEFGIQVSHGITPEEREKILAGLNPENGPLNEANQSPQPQPSEGGD